MDVPTHPVVKLLISPEGEKKNVGLIGYPGPSEVGGRVRLYLDLALNRYFEFAATDVIAVEPNSIDKTGPSLVFVKPSAEVSFTEAAAVSSSASMLRGALAGRLVPLNGSMDTSPTASSAACDFMIMNYSGGGAPTASSAPCDRIAAIVASHTGSSSPCSRII